MSSVVSRWYEAGNAEQFPSPALLIYPDRVEANLRRMIKIAGGPELLRPHVKTHKMADVVRMQRSLGIEKFKCATIAEAEMLADTGASDVLLAYPLLGIQAERALQLTAKFPSTQFTFMADCVDALRQLAHVFASAGRSAEVLLDLNVGMDRTGTAPACPAALEVYGLMSRLSGVRPGGLHAYDGHIADSNLDRRTAECDQAFVLVDQLRQTLRNAGFPVPRIVAGGTPTFPIHVKREGVECSPGTCILWDFGYADKLPDLNFDYAAVLMTRVVSRPTRNRLCLDLGYKAVAADQPQPRVRLFECPEAECVAHNEEHLVVETPNAENFPVGSVFYAVPKHICPTVALHREALVVRGGSIEGAWPVSARDRRLTI